MLLFTFVTVGTNMTTKENSPSNFTFMLMSFSVLFFSAMDCMDGLRARRQKSGSPFGRIFDEALDTI